MTVQSFQASEFSVELPDGVIDASSYCFVFPHAGEFPPNLIIRCEHQPAEFDLAAYVAAQREALEASAENFTLVNEISSKRDFWTYIVSIVEWGPDDSRIRQKQTYVFVPGQRNRLFILTGSDLADNFEQSDGIFNQVIRTLKPLDNAGA